MNKDNNSLELINMMLNKFSGGLSVRTTAKDLAKIFEISEWKAGDLTRRLKAINRIDIDKVIDPTPLTIEEYDYSGTVVKPTGEKKPKKVKGLLKKALKLDIVGTGGVNIKIHTSIGEVEANGSPEIMAEFVKRLFV